MNEDQLSGERAEKVVGLKGGMLSDPDDAGGGTDELELEAGGGRGWNGFLRGGSVTVVGEVDCS